MIVQEIILNKKKTFKHPSASDTSSTTFIACAYSWCTGTYEGFSIRCISFHWLPFFVYKKLCKIPFDEAKGKKKTRLTLLTPFLDYLYWHYKFIYYLKD